MAGSADRHNEYKPKPGKRPIEVQRKTSKPTALRLLCAAVAMMALPGYALDLEFPAPATQTFARTEALTSFALPVGPFSNGAAKTELIEGGLNQTAWRLQAKGLTTLQILMPLRDQLAAAGFTTIFECETFACGGFDFRFGIDIAAEPAMHIDLGDFRYVAAKRNGSDGPEHVALIVSRSSTLGFVQLTQIGKAGAAPTVLETPTATPEDPATPVPPVTDDSPMGEGLAKQGSVALDDLIFASGAAELEAGEYASLEALANYLRANPETKVALVGHTDASGGLAGNVALSRKRAESVRDRLIESYAIPDDQIVAEGVGYLAPRDSNLTESGLTRNRRVEVMLLVNP
jgi:outer membrane protein OmpA-like peptidoglycan-associated protein